MNGSSDTLAGVGTGGGGGGHYKGLYKKELHDQSRARWNCYGAFSHYQNIIMLNN